MLTFFSALFLSFIGSLPFGMINMAVAYTAIHKGIRAGVYMGMGAALVELLQVFVALKFTWLFEAGGVLGNVVKVAAIFIFFGAGIYFFFFAKAAPEKMEKKIVISRYGEFIKGMGISSLNLMVIPYWIFYGTLLVENGWLKKENGSIMVFSTGAMTGAFLLLATYAWLGDRVLRKSGEVTQWVNKFIGVVLIAFGVYQVVSMAGQE